MNSPITALVWEIWRRGRRSVWLAAACLSASAFINLVSLDQWRVSESARDVFPDIFGLLMVLSFLFLLGMFNHTETNSAKDWHGFPYRHFVLPVRTWQLVAVPLVVSVTVVELFYFLWLKLVWTRQHVVMPEWFAVVLGAYVIFYQMTLWSLAGLRIARIAVLGLGGVSSIAVACLPMFAWNNPSPWLSERRLIGVVAVTAAVAAVIAWAEVSRQRRGGGRRASWRKTAWLRIVDRLPRRSADFASASAAQFWFEWRRTGFLLPACTAVVLVFIVAPVTWLFRADASFTVGALLKILGVPLLLGFAIGKGFCKPEFWSLSLSLPPFLAVRPMPSGEFVVCKMKVAAWSVALSWLQVILFILLWLPGWAATRRVQMWLFLLRQFYPHSWGVILALALAALATLSWRFMISGMWAGLSGKRFYYFATAAQVIAPLLLLIACGIWSGAIDTEIHAHPDKVKSAAIRAIAWLLSLAVIAKVWFAVFSWSKITTRRARHYLALWLAATFGSVALAVLIYPPMDTYRQEHLYVLAALSLFPLARLGLAPAAFEGNRHQ